MSNSERKFLVVVRKGIYGIERTGTGHVNKNEVVQKRVPKIFLSNGGEVCGRINRLLKWQYIA